MIKKILASISILSLFATSLVTGTGLLQASAVSDDTVVSDLKVSDTKFDPAKGDSSTVKFLLNEDSTLKVYVKNVDTGEYVFLADDIRKRAGTQTYDFYGRTGNTASGTLLPYGKYRVSVIAKDPDTLRLKDYDWIDVYLVISSDPVMPTPPVEGNPTVSNLSITPTSINVDENEYATTSFRIGADAYVKATVTNSSNTVVKTFSDYNGTVKYSASNTYSLRWNGTNNAGDKVNGGRYYINVSTRNSSGTDLKTGTIAVTVNPVLTVAPRVLNLALSHTSINVDEDEFTTASFNISQDAYVKANVTNSSNTVVKTFSAYNDTVKYSASNNYTLNWDGKNNAGSKVGAGRYYVNVTVRNDKGQTSQSKAVMVTVNSLPDDDDDEDDDDEYLTTSGPIKNFKIDPTTTWDPADEDLLINFRLTEDVNDLRVYAKNNKDGEIVELLDESKAYKDDYEVIWDGTDYYDDYADAGTWGIFVTVNNGKYKVYDDVKIEYSNPKITDAFLSKDSIDTDLDEFTNLIFRVDKAASVTVELHRNNKKERVLLDDEDVSKNKWYTVEWDGLDDDGDRADEDAKWKFVVRAKNQYNSNVYDKVEVTVDVSEDRVASKRVNVTNDYTNPVIYDYKGDSDTLTFSYYIEDDADVYLAVYKNHTAVGSPVAELLDYASQSEGHHSVKWVVMDDDDKKLKDGVYSYKLITNANGSYKDTEKGRFVVGSAGYTYSDDDDDDSDDDDDDFPVGGLCNDYYWDVNSVDNDLCVSITWATQAGIFQGYSDGSFRPYAHINRAEVLKVLFEAFSSHVAMLPADGTTQGFYDVDPGAWYMPYVRTAKAYGMLHGYLNQTEARLSNTINRVEILKFALEASDAFTDYEMAGYERSYYHDVDPGDTTHDWFFDYAGAAYQYGLFNYYYDSQSNKKYLAPGNHVTRGEVAQLLYRMYRQGLLG